MNHSTPIPLNTQMNFVKNARLLALCSIRFNPVGVLERGDFDRIAHKELKND